MKKTRWYVVDDERNSISGSAYMRDLDFSEWWTDDFGGELPLYLHVPHKKTRGMEGTVHRVHCRRESKKPRIGMRKGRLCWVLEGKRKKK